MKYPVNPTAVIRALEVETGSKLSPSEKTLWAECLVPLANNAHERGRCGEPLHSRDSIKDWKKFYDSDPEPEIASFLKLVMKFEHEIYEEGKQAVATEKEMAHSGRM